VFTSGCESPVAFTQPELGLPTDILDHFGLFSSRSCKCRLTLAGYW
jgi:hypothetical protein